MLHLNKALTRFTIILTMFFIMGGKPLLAGEAKIDSDSALAFMEEVAGVARPILDAQNMDEKERIQLFSDLLRNYFALNQLGKFVMAQHWRTLDDAQRTAFTNVFQTYVIQVNANRLSAFKGATVAIKKAQKIGRSDQIVQSHWLEIDQTTPVNVNWRVRMIDDQVKILDVNIEGVSMAQTQRDEFQSILSREGFDELLQLLATKNAQFSQK